MREYVVATGNRGKLAEIAAIVGSAGLELRAQADFGVEPAEETGATFVENALIKARHAASATGLPAIADDSGLCVRALDGAPGVRSARYAGAGASDARNVERLLAALAHVPDAARDAVFVCVAVALHGPADADPVIVSGRWVGRIARAPAGAGGFGYDPVFVDPATGRAAAELAAAEKNAASHRGAAFRALLGALAARGPRAWNGHLFTMRRA